MRKRSQITSIENALREQGLPVEVIGIGGLIHIPEVADVVTLMKIITDPDAGSSRREIGVGVGDCAPFLT